MEAAWVMKIIDYGNPKTPHPHRCEVCLYNFVHKVKTQINMGVTVECDCGAQWQVRATPGLRGHFGDYHICGNAYWVRIKRGMRRYTA